MKKIIAVVSMILMTSSAWADEADTFAIGLAASGFVTAGASTGVLIKLSNEIATNRAALHTQQRTLVFAKPADYARALNSHGVKAITLEEAIKKGVKSNKRLVAVGLAIAGVSAYTAGSYDLAHDDVNLGKSLKEGAVSALETASKIKLQAKFIGASEEEIIEVGHQ